MVKYKKCAGKSVCSRVFTLANMIRVGQIDQIPLDQWCFRHHFCLVKLKTKSNLMCFKRTQPYFVINIPGEDIQSNPATELNSFACMCLVCVPRSHLLSK